MIGDIRRFLLLPHIKVQNANALSSPFTIGLPAMTAWLGAMHALERRINRDGLNAIILCQIGVITHKVDLQTYKGRGDYVYSIIGTGNPLDKDGKRPSFIEEARCHLDVSLVIEYKGIGKEDEEIFLDQVTHHLKGKMKIAGGDILDFKAPILYRIEEGDEASFRRFIRLLMPGYAIIERRDLMIDAMSQGQDALEVLSQKVV